MKNITLSQDFFFGGKAIFTVQNTTTQEHVTYKIKITKPTAQFPRPSTLLLQMTGTNNENHYSYVGKVDRAMGHLNLTKGSKFTADSKQVNSGRWVIDRIVNNKQIPDCIEIRHSGRCGRCGRTLTTPESLDRGIGPECWGIMHPHYSDENED